MLLLFYGMIYLFFSVVGFSVYRQLLVAGCTLYYEIDGKAFSFSVSNERIRFRSDRRPGFEAYLDAEGVYANTVFLISLILATPGMRLDRRLQRLGIGLFFLFITHVMFLVSKVEVSLITAQHPLAGSAVFWTFWDDFLEIAGKIFFPVAIWLLLGMNFMLGDVEKSRKVRRSLKLGRNQPCPCGSGKKYKRCCGRAV
jgi:hypothetical protein